MALVDIREIFINSEVRDRQRDCVLAADSGGCGVRGQRERDSVRGQDRADGGSRSRMQMVDTVWSSSAEKDMKQVDILFELVSECIQNLCACRAYRLASCPD